MRWFPLGLYFYTSLTCVSLSLQVQSTTWTMKMLKVNQTKVTKVKKVTLRDEHGDNISTKETLKWYNYDQENS